MPFHFWAPDTYEGAPVPVAAYLSVVSKAAGFVGLVAAADGRLPRRTPTSGRPTIAVLAALTMTVGNLVALRQRQAVRLLAWSSVAQSGYMLRAARRGRGSGDVDGGAAGDGRLRAGLRRDEPRRVRGRDAGRAAPAGQPARRLPRARPHRAARRRSRWPSPWPAWPGCRRGCSVCSPRWWSSSAPVDQGVGWLAVVMAVNVVIGLDYYLAWAASLYGRPEPWRAPAVVPHLLVGRDRRRASRSVRPSGCRSLRDWYCASADGGAGTSGAGRAFFRSTGRPPGHPRPPPHDEEHPCTAMAPPTGSRQPS